jgi:hypothetical protein
LNIDSQLKCIAITFSPHNYKTKTMRPLTTLLRLSAIALITLVITGISWAPVKSGCHKINAKAVGNTVSMSETGVVTEADIIGGGLLNGSTRANLSFTGGSGDELFFGGTVVLTTKHGTVTYDVVSGTFNTTTLAFSADLVATQGDGRFAGATGTLHLQGVNNPDGTFTEDISGVICLLK